MSNLSAFLDMISHSEGTDRAPDPYRVSKRPELVKFSLREDICGMGGFWGLKRSKMFSPLSWQPNFSLIFEFSVSAYTKKSKLIVTPSAALILLITIGRNIAKICKAIVFPVAIYVINFVLRPFAGNVEPHQSVREITDPIDTNLYISAVVFVASYVARLYAIGPWRWSFKPREKTRCSIVAKQFAQPFGIYHGV
jgi:hypothetical protein